MVESLLKVLCDLNQGDMQVLMIILILLLSYRLQYNINILEIRRCGGSLVLRTTDVLGRGPTFEHSISHNDPDALQDHCVIM